MPAPFDAHHEHRSVRGLLRDLLDVEPGVEAVLQALAQGRDAAAGADAEALHVCCGWEFTMPRETAR